MPETKGRIPYYQSGKRRLLSSQKSKGSTSKSNKEKSTFTTLFTAILTRLFFLSHTGIALWRVSHYYPKEILYLLVIGIALLLIETLYTTIVRRGKEYKWFTPSVFFYLVSVVPCLWLLELNEIKQFSDIAEAKGGCNKTVGLLTISEEHSDITSATDLLLTSTRSEYIIRNRHDNSLQFAASTPQNREIDAFLSTGSVENITVKHSVSITTAAATTKHFHRGFASSFPASDSDESNSAFDNITSSIINFGEEAIRRVEALVSKL